MKGLSEVCKLVGVTRRALQGYDEIKLLQPTLKDANKRWYYNDEAISKLIVIQIFVEAGYERKAIRDLLKSPMMNLHEELERLVDNLEQKRKRIDGMISTIKNMQLTTALPENTLRAISRMDIGRLYSDKSFMAYLEDSIANYEEYTVDENEEVKSLFPLFSNIFAVGCLKEMPEKSEQVQGLIEQIHKDIIEITNDNGEMAEGFLVWMKEMAQDVEFVHNIESRCGEGSMAYIVRAIQVYCDGKKIDILARE